MVCPLINICPNKVTLLHAKTYCTTDRYMECPIRAQPREWLSFLTQHESVGKEIFTYRSRHGSTYILTEIDGEYWFKISKPDGRMEKKSLKSCVKELVRCFKSGGNILDKKKVSGQVFPTLVFLQTIGKVARRKEGKNVYWEWIGDYKIDLGGVTLVGEY